jgi:2-aminoethylphosphonate-pyruvate transaminase
MTSPDTRIDTAVILAAGRGSRLGALNDGRPKGFLTLGRESIVEESIARLRRAGVRRVVIVTGYEASWYAELAARSPGVELVHNAQFDESGSMYSLALAAARLSGPFLLLESDLIYEQRALSSLLNLDQDNIVLVGGFSAAGDEVFIGASPEGTLVDMGKNRAAVVGSVIGELVGISRISPAALSAMLEFGEAEFRRTLNVDYESALVAAATKVPVQCLVVDDLIWSEIDDPSHLERARSIVYPFIVDRDGG